MTVDINIERLWREQRFVDERPKVEKKAQVPKSLEEFHKMLEGDSEWSGEIHLWVLSRDAFLVLHSDDLDLVPWTGLPNVLLLDVPYSRDTFTQYLASAKNAVAKRRGHWQIPLQPMLKADWDIICQF